METSRLKNIIILILALTNLCLLGLLTMRFTTGYAAGMRRGSRWCSCSRRRACLWTAT